MQIVYDKFHILQRFHPSVKTVRYLNILINIYLFKINTAETLEKSVKYVQS